ncbi:MAG TPA: hypothetical protein ENG77_03050 [Chromatiales bacterium]|nr:hypothetical protein [Chromatiales bacterium]
MSKVVIAGVLGLVLAGCATPMPRKVAPTPGYTFGYRVHGKTGAQVFSNGVETFVTLSPGVRVLKSLGDGRSRPVNWVPPYWVLRGLAGRWELTTTRGVVSIRAPEVVAQHAKLLEAAGVVRTTKPKPVVRTWKWKVLFHADSARLDNKALRRLGAIALKINRAVHVDGVWVSGATTPTGTLEQNAGVGASRASAVADTLALDGAVPVEDRGWDRSLKGPYALVVAKVQVWRKPQEFGPVVGKRGAKAAKAVKAAKAAKVAKAVKVKKVEKAAAVKARKPREVKFSVKGGELLSHALGNFLTKRGWSMQWRSPVDYSVRYPASFRGHDLRKVLVRVTAAWPIRVHLYAGNRVAVVTGGVR